MPRQVFDYDSPERFVAGTVGEPGQRTFFLQAAAGGRVTSVALEKQQVAVLAERIEVLLDEVVARAAGNSSVPAVAPPAMVDQDPLTAPIEEEFRVGTMALAWDEGEESLIVEAQAVSDEEELEEETALIDSEAEEGPPLLRVRMTGAQARAFAARAQAVVAAGRPPCPFCGGPLDASGHVCPRANGYRR